MRHQRVVRGGRLVDEDIEGCAADLPVFQGIEQRALVDDAAARCVDHEHTRLRLRERLRPEQTDGLLGLRHMHRDEVGTCEQIVERHQLVFDLIRGGSGDEGIVRDHLHAEPTRTIGDDAANVPQADHA